MKQFVALAWLSLCVSCAPPTPPTPVVTVRPIADGQLAIDSAPRDECVETVTIRENDAGRALVWAVVQEAPYHGPCRTTFKYPVVPSGYRLWTNGPSATPREGGQYIAGAEGPGFHGETIFTWPSE